MTTLHVYLAQDRLRALTRGETLPDRTTGSALFADLSGFTVLTESLRESLGARQGAEELSKQLEAVYSALIAEVEKYGGSVIGFAGDAMMCWFDLRDGGQEAELKTVSAAFGMQRAIQQFPTLALKVSIASGNARRFVVGDEEIQRLDALAGATVARTAIGEHLANKGEILVDEVTANAQRETALIKEWRTDTESNERFGVITQTIGDRPESKTESLHALTNDVLKRWVHDAVYDRETSGQGTFLTEFRPCAALFVRFTGIDYDSDSAESELDAFIREVQRIALRYEGTLMDITIGDKGSYVYVNFGALSAHEDDARRAVKTALELMKASPLQLQTGITQGLMRVGAYGGETRKVFGALGDDVNLAARLMTTASVGEILLSSHVHKAVMSHFTFEPRPPLLVKGKAEPLPVFAVTGESQKRAIRLQEPTYALPMVGRQQELGIINDKLQLAREGKGQVIGIVAEAGLGKSRLVAEVIRSARRKGFVGYGGACQSDGSNTPYLAWKPIWQAFFDIDPSAPLKKQLRNLEGELEDRVPERWEAMPLLGILLDLEISENDFTRNLEPKYKQSALRALLEDCLRAAAKDESLLIVVEDFHWIDALSHDLLEELTRGLMDCRVCFLLAYRPPPLQRLQAPRIESMSNFTRIELHELNQAEAEQAIRAKLAQLYPARTGAVPAALVEKLMRRAQGNPFYLEELLNYLRDRGLDPREPQALEKIELPDSLHTVILSRLDQLSEREKTTLRVASIIGRLFRATWLTGYYPALGELAHVKVDLDRLDSMDITPLDSEPELAYLFKHIVTHEVTYESLPFGLRAKLHEQLARYLERQIASGVVVETALLDTLVFHYTHSENKAKQCLYLQKAGQAALEISAFRTALEYFTRLLELIPNDDPSRSTLALELAETHYRVGNYPAARMAIQQAQSAAQTDTDRAAALALLGVVTTAMGDYNEAQAILTEAVPLARASGDTLTLFRALFGLGDMNYYLNKLEEAQIAWNESLSLARALGDVPRELAALNALGALIGVQGDLDGEERILHQVLQRAIAAGNRHRAMGVLNDLGVVAFDRKDYVAAREHSLQALVLAREIGAQQQVASALIAIGSVNFRLAELPAARSALREGMALAVRFEARGLVVGAVLCFSELAYAERQTERALALLGLARSQPAWNSEHQRGLDLNLAEWAIDPSLVEAGLAKGAELDWDETIRNLLSERLGLAD